MKRRRHLFWVLLGFGWAPVLGLFALQYQHYRALPDRLAPAIAEVLRARTPEASPAEGNLRLQAAVAAAVRDRIRQPLVSQVAAVALLGLLAAAAGGYAARKVTGTLRMLVDGLERLAAGDFSVRFPEGTRDERDRLIQAFNAMVPRLEAHVQTQQALGIAQEIQRNFMPKHPPCAESLDIAVSNIACDETGGDYVDVLCPEADDGGRVLLAVGDVSGHGIGPALLMADARGMLRALASQGGELHPTVARLNRLLLEDVGDSGHFMTLFLAELDVPTGVLRWVRAGHDPAYLYDPDSGTCAELGGSGAALGVLAEARFESRVVDFSRPGQMLIMATDGVWEARDPENRLFGKDRLREVVRRNAAQPAAEVKAAIVEAVQTFRRSAKPSDDITVVVVKRT